MTITLPPQKPFNNFKWRWAALTPTESLNDPSVFLGVLRVYNKYDGFHPGSREVLDELLIVQRETNCPVDLARTSDRNLIRNSGQYWKLFGLLNESHGRISVTNFGKMLSNGEITKIEFATTIIKTFELPNRNIMSDADTAEWDRIGLKIKPLQLILEILNSLNNNYGSKHAYITSDELVKIIIPLSGAFAQLNDYCEAVVLFRNGELNINDFPNCAPESNDERMAKEYLLFLRNYGYINEDQRNKYTLLNISKDEIEELDKIIIENELPENVVKYMQLTQIPANIERKKVSRELLGRPYQSSFRKNILNVYDMKCIITGVDIDDVLEAAHIIPVSNNGNDQIENGLCLRSDIHSLYDTGHLKIFPDGNITISDIANAPNNYMHLPRHIEIPEFVNKYYLYWRTKYY